MLTHHSATDYNVAASEAAKEARGKFEAEIERGKTRALAVIEQVNRDVPQDRIVAAEKLDFFVNDKGIRVRFPDGHQTEEGFHRHAVGQAAAKAEIPMTFIDRLMEKGEWGRSLVAENLNRIYRNGGRNKVLTRSVGSEVRGFLSDSYRRMDSRPILESFIAGVQGFGAVPVDGFALQTKIAVKVVLPYVFEPVNNEVMIFGAAFENSDFGDGAVSVRSFVERLWCTNRAISTEDLRQIHLGRRLSENLQLSQRTYDLDTRTMASAVQDIVGNTLSPVSVNRYLDTIKQANEQKIEGRAVTEYLKKNLRKAEAEAAIEAFNSPEVEMLPPGQTAWRMSNAISWIANTKIEDESRKLDLMKVAGAILDAKLPAAA
ncbi:MAG: hypothetical protein B7Z80_08685 [Rhodospirillales bacterium 20-64-7]|nr:MAG: hypothetical protein B7Z80_08685 [Rhodospirillales bacterium 20-64-7]